MVTGLFGTPLAAANLATVGAWLFWWIAIIFVILFLGKSWCFVCPWNALAEWTRWGTPWNRRRTPLSLERPWPRWARNIFPALIFFAVFIWLELGVGLTLLPAATALLALILTVLAVASAVIFRNMPFCRYFCPVGRVAGLYSLVSPIELRSADPAACAACRNKDCLRGNSAGYPCPTAQYPGRLEKNTYCLLCLECAKTCPKDNLRLSPRPFAADLLAPFRPRRDEAYGALALLALVLLHTLTMVPPWTNLDNALQLATGLGYWPNVGLAYAVSFTFLMLVFLALPALVHWLGAAFAARLGSGNQAPLVTAGSLFLAFAYPLIPLALALHLAHNLMHVNMEMADLIPVLSDPFGWGWNLLGTARYIPLPQLFSAPALAALQVVLILLGLGLSIAVSWRLARRLFPAGRRLWATAPFLLAQVAYAGVGWWLLTLPMTMKLPY